MTTTNDTMTEELWTRAEREPRAFEVTHRAGAYAVTHTCETDSDGYRWVYWPNRYATMLCSSRFDSSGKGDSGQRIRLIPAPTTQPPTTSEPATGETKKCAADREWREMNSTLAPSSSSDAPALTVNDKPAAGKATGYVPWTFITMPVAVKVRDKVTGHVRLVQPQFNNFARFTAPPTNRESQEITFWKLMDEWEQLDGTPCGDPA